VAFFDFEHQDPYIVPSMVIFKPQMGNQFFSFQPSLLQRILVENHPATPNIRALNAGARTVFIFVFDTVQDASFYDTGSQYLSA
jgi:hypothetical protein